MKDQSAKTRRLAQLSLLLALEAVLAFTPLGFILIPPIAITILHIPVIIGGVLLGPGAGAFLGGTFGLFSMVRAATSGSPGDILFNPFASGNPFGSVVMAVVPRILLGLLAAGVYRLLHKKCKQPLAIGVAAAVASVAHSLGVLGLLSLFFAAFPLLSIFEIIVKVNGLLELGAAIVISMAVCGGVLRAQHKK